MKVTGIIAEFNPFHNGHARLIEHARETGSTHVVAVMSGNFVQRGEPAVLPDRVRAAAALRGGVDLVLQLPIPYAVSNANRFSSGAIDVLEGLGCVDELLFGSECGDLELLRRCASSLMTEVNVYAALHEELKKGLSFPAARVNAIRSVDPALAEVMSEPNNILGVAYLHDLYCRASTIKPRTLLRAGAAHDSETPAGRFASGSEIRRRMLAGEDWQRFVPEAVAPVMEAAVAAGRGPVSEQAFEKIMLASLRLRPIPPETPDLSEGIERRLTGAAQRAVTMEELFHLAKTKRYPLARLRRIAWMQLIGITKDDVFARAPYIRPLGFNENGAQLLAAARKGGTYLPVLNKPALLPLMQPQAQRCFSLECAAADLYALCRPLPGLGGSQLNLKPVVRHETD